MEIEQSYLVAILFKGYKIPGALHYLSSSIILKTDFSYDLSPETYLTFLPLRNTFRR